ncbi:sulfite exporter TauE/SafE family protein [Fuscibacter oryzae]|uniref:Probable membrane transporter protein n=1 Tax=Fuscibacter oryzae TaxID=2803939 RepID=A0A8J7SQN1_9RHOB|nr:sulfite exporter TauE/SafE family protein [Fuscibacter oryzae]MBL4926916.1 sulfite exporter TauE/SafE family protein [Fuscibacter oryzae]
MQLYLPIAEVSINAFLLTGIGAIVGFLSGMFGVGGGFLITPLLLLIGVPPGIAVATGANQVVASSISGVLAQFRRKAVDVPMGLVLMSGGLVGSWIGSKVFAWMTALGQVDLFVQLSYVAFLGIIGTVMFIESARAIWRSKRPGSVPVRRAHTHGWMHGLPFKMKFRASGLYISVLPPIAVGTFVGFLGGIMGVGGGFILVPAMIYLLGMPTKVVIGTSLFQIIFVSGFTTVLYAVNTHTVDMLLALLLIVGGVIGAQVGAQVGLRLKAEQLRILLAILVLAVAIKIAFDLLFQPTELFSINIGRLP